jgi:hypothetical protein
MTRGGTNVPPRGSLRRDRRRPGFPRANGCRSMRGMPQMPSGVAPQSATIPAAIMDRCPTAASAPGWPAQQSRPSRQPKLGPAGSNTETRPARRGLLSAMSAQGGEPRIAGRCGACDGAPAQPCPRSSAIATARRAAAGPAGAFATGKPRRCRRFADSIRDSRDQPDSAHTTSLS